MSLADQYATSSNLDARIALHQHCSTNEYGFQRWVFDRLQLQGGERVLEIGCGSGSLWRENGDRYPGGVTLVLSDFSMAMIGSTRAAMDAEFVNCALPELPFAGESFDCVIANHMLYHVRDRHRALDEIRRVLRPDGELYAATNGADHLRELKDLLREFDIDGGDLSASFTLENGAAQLNAVFGTVDRDDYPDSLRVTDAQLLLDYINSLTSRAAWTVRYRGAELRARIDERIASEGAFTIRKSTGLFVAR